jgi:hypothetical protein
MLTKSRRLERVAAAVAVAAAVSVLSITGTVAFVAAHTAPVAAPGDYLVGPVNVSELIAGPLPICGAGNNPPAVQGSCVTGWNPLLTKRLAAEAMTGATLPDAATIHVLTASGQVQTCVHHISPQAADGTPSQVTAESWICDLPGMKSGTAFRAHAALPHAAPWPTN